VSSYVKLSILLFPGEQVPVNKIAEAIQMCLDYRMLYEDLIAIVIVELFEGDQLPSLFLQTVKHAITSYPHFRAFLLNILALLISKQIWNETALWADFIDCCKVTSSRSRLVHVNII